MIGQKNYYTDLFSIDVPQMERLVGEALSGGGDYADLYFENTAFRDLYLRDGVVSSGGYHIDYGVGIRTLVGEKTGYAYTESTDMKAMLSAAQAAAAISPGIFIPSDKPTVAFKGSPNPSADRYPVERDWREWDTAEGAAFLGRLDKMIRARDSRVVKVIGMISCQMSDIMMFNSRGELKYDTRPMGTVAVSLVMGSGDKVRNNHVSRSYRIGAEMLTDALAEEMAGEALRNIDDRFEAKRPEKGGAMSVVMGAGASGILLHEAMGHAFEADFNRKGQSVFSDRMGSRICAGGINIVDDGTIRGNRGALNFDDEGVPGQKTYMVEDGVLASYLHDRISASWYGVRPTGNGRRESFRYNPVPRMRATYMEGGNSTPEEIISSVKKGIYVDEFANGQVKIGEGDFTFYVKSGYMIENGRLGRPVCDLNIIGNGPKALADIVAVGNDARIDDGAWTCGKEQNVPVSCGIPTVRVDNLIVGGEN